MEVVLRCKKMFSSTLRVDFTMLYVALIWMYMQSNLKQSQNQAEKLKKLSDVKRKVNFRFSQVEAFINDHF